MLTIEPEGETTHGRCQDCAQMTRTVWGYVFRDSRPHAAYFARWTDGHLERGAQILISLGGWGGGDPSVRRSVGIECRMEIDRPSFVVVDADTLPWTRESALGEPLSREVALKAPIADEVFHILDQLIVDDSRINEFLLSQPHNAS